MREICRLSVVVLAVAGCTSSGGDQSDAGFSLNDGDPLPDALLGTEGRPGGSCVHLRDAGLPSGVYWVAPEDSPAFEVYCEQELQGGGWAMLYNSVHSAAGTTTTFWQFVWGGRLGQIGSPAPEENYYHGSLYLTGIEYMDAITDLAGTTEVAAVVTVTALDITTMGFFSPVLVSGDAEIFAQQFAGGWSSSDHDGDAFETNCAAQYANVAQHYGAACWRYNLGADGDGEGPFDDGGVGPHVHNDSLTGLGLALQPDGGTYSQVGRIARYVKW